MASQMAAANKAGEDEKTGRWRGMAAAGELQAEKLRRCVRILSAGGTGGWGRLFQRETRRELRRERYICRER